MPPLVPEEFRRTVETLHRSESGRILAKRQGGDDRRPYAETKEQLGGIQILEARDLNHVIELVSQLPGFKYGLGPIEIRPVADLNEMKKASKQRRRENAAR